MNVMESADTAVTWNTGIILSHSVAAARAPLPDLQTIADTFI